MALIIKRCTVSEVDFFALHLPLTNWILCHRWWAQYTAALPQLDYFPGLPYIIQNPPLCVISCQFFEEQSSQGGRGNFLPQNFQFVSSHIMPGLAVQQITLSAFKTVHIECLLSCCRSFVINFFFSPLSMSQKPYQTVASLSALPDNPATEHRWVFFTTSAVALRPLKGRSRGPNEITLARSLT